MAERVVVVRVVAVRLACRLCGDSIRLGIPPGEFDLEEFVTGPGSVWTVSHLRPVLAAVELMTPTGLVVMDHGD